MIKKFDYEKFFMGVGDLSDRKSGKIKIGRFEYRMRNFLNQVKEIRGKICDIGCGGGDFLAKMQVLFPRGEYYGCDISKTAIDMGASLSSPQISFSLIGKEGILPYQNDYFDLCASFNVLEHVEDVQANIREIFRILRPGGIFHLCVPCEGEPFSMNWFYSKTGLGKSFTYKNWGHIQPELTHREMKKILESSGFEIEKINYSLHLPVDFWNLFLYFLPKEFMGLFLGKKAYAYTDAGMTISQFDNKKRFNLLILLRRFWLIIFKIYEFFRSLDAIVLGNLHFTASTMHITCVKK